MQKFTRTAADIFRIVPFAIFIVVPFMELFIPIYLKFFPGMLPSTFTEESKKQEKIRKQMRVRLHIAKFLQDTLEETAVHSKKQNSSNQVSQFTEFMKAIRTGKRELTNEEILKFAALLEDDLTLGNLNHIQLVCLCQLLNLSSVGPDYVLRLQIQLRLRFLQADDKLIQRDGVDSLTFIELTKACRDRGMCSTGISSDRLKSHLRQWIDFHVNRRIPAIILLLSRSFYLPDEIEPEQLSKTIAQLPQSVEMSTTRKLADSQGVRIDNIDRLDEIRREEEAIAKENKEIEEEIVPVKVSQKSITSGDRDSDSDLDVIATRLASALTSLASKKHIDFSDLKYDEFKEEVLDYQHELQNNSQKSNQLLTKNITRLLNSLHSLSDKLNKRQKQLKEKIEESKDHNDIEPLDEKRDDLVHLNELLAYVDRIRVSGINDKFNDDTIVEVIKTLDLDGDGQIAVSDILQVLEFIHNPDTKMSKQSIEEIAEMIAKERLADKVDS